MIRFNDSVLAGVALSLAAGAPVLAQEDQGFLLEEIIVSARKREESLQEVPVSISVFSADLISEAGILEQYDLFEMTPGIHYDEAIDRASSLPSIRGVQSNEIATNRAKVTSFVDGMPILGSQGTLQFAGVQQVEVYRGPQSAAFGRSTFGGAINYITKDPSAEFEGALDLNISDFGRQIVGAEFSGPLSDTVGYHVNLRHEDSSALDEYIATDGTELGTRGEEYFSGKLKFMPSDAVDIEVMYTTLDAADGPPVRYFISQADRDACWDGTITSGMGSGVYLTGLWDCNSAQGPRPVMQHDSTLGLDPSSPEYQVALAYSIPQDRIGVFDARDRLQTQMDFTLPNETLLQLSAFYGEEEYIRWSDTDGNDDPLDILPPAMAMGPAMGPPMGSPFYSVNPMSAISNARGAMADPSAIEETYVELRWVSPSDQQTRWLVGVSYYDYDFLTEIYFGNYNGLLTGVDQSITGPIAPLQVFQETAANTGVFANVSYDLTDTTTVTLEGRYQTDDAGAVNQETGLTLINSTDAFLPRLSITYNPSGNVSWYGQIAKGNNPAGVNVGFTDPLNITNLQLANRNGWVDYDEDTFLEFREEEILQVEAGVKASLLEGRLQLAAAVYSIDWDDQAQSVNLDWNDPNYMGPMVDGFGNRTFVNEGDLEMQGAEIEATWLVGEGWNLRGTLGLLDAKYADYCSVNALNEGFRATRSEPYSCSAVDGREVAQQPRVSGSLSAGYRAAAGNTGWDWSSRLDMRHEGEQWNDQTNTMKLPAVTTLNGSLGLRNDQWNLTLYANNLTDEDAPRRYGRGNDYTITTVSPGFTGGPRGNYQSNFRITPRIPREFGLRANFQF